MKVVMAGAVGLGIGVAMGVGGYMAYKAMTQPNKYPQTGTGYDQSWCQRPGGTGSLMQCSECFKKHGSMCTPENRCFESGGCDYKVKNNMERDDIMTAGFVPQLFVPPLTVTITKITGGNFAKADVCPVESSGTPTFDSNWVKASSVDVDLFMTITQVEQLDNRNNQGQGQANSAWPLGTSPFLVFACLFLMRLFHSRL